MKRAMAVAVMSLCAGCANVSYEVRPIGQQPQGAMVAMTFGQKAATVAANNWGKILSGIGLGITAALVGENNNWFRGSSDGKASGSSSGEPPASYSRGDTIAPSVSLAEIHAPVTIEIDITGRDRMTP